MTQGREYEILEICIDNLETLTPEQQDHVITMLCARFKYKATKINSSTTSGSNRPSTNYRRKAKPF